MKKKKDEWVCIQHEAWEKRSIIDAKQALGIDLWEDVEEALRRREQIQSARVPSYLISLDVVPDTAITRSLATFIAFCYNRPNKGSILFKKCDKEAECDIDDLKLSRILQYMYGVYVEDVLSYFAQHKVADLMCHVEAYASPAYQVNWEGFEKWKQERMDELQDLFKLHNMGKPVRLESSIDDIGMDKEVFYGDVFYRYHFVVSPCERFNLNTFEEISDYILYRLWNGGGFHQPFNDIKRITVFKAPLEDLLCKFKDDSGGKGKISIK